MCPKLLADMATINLAFDASPLAHLSHRQDFNKRLLNSGIEVLSLRLLDVGKTASTQAHDKP
jgi:hypothetical protein